MPAWLVALLVAFVGFVGVFSRIAYDRGADLRTRMLDAADDFVTAVTSAHEAIGSAVLPTSIWLAIAYLDTPDQRSEQIREDQKGKVESAQSAAGSAWERSRQRVPRVALLFGVDSPAAVAAKRTDDALGTALVGLVQIYAESTDPEAEPLDDDLVVERATEHLESATSGLREFSTAAHAAITGWRPMRRRSRSHSIE